jgi:hypothetical protein
LFASLAMVVLGGSILSSVHWMRKHRWETRGSVVSEEVPSGAMHLRMHAVRVDKAHTDALLRSKTFPSAIRPLVLRMSQTSDVLLALLAKEGRPVTVVGPSGALFRVSDRLPVDDRHRELYGEEMDWSDVRREIDALKAASERATSLRSVIYALPYAGGAGMFPFEVDESKTFAEAYETARTSGGVLRLLAVHSDVTSRGCP